MPANLENQQWPQDWKQWFHANPRERQYQVMFSSVQCSHSVVSNSLRPHELQHARPPVRHQLLESHIKWALGSITVNKASGGDGIPAELFQVLEDDAVKVLYSICQQIWKTQQWPQDWKRSVFIPIPKKFSSVTQSCPTLCNPMNRSMPGLPVHHQLLEFTQTHVHWVGDAIQPSHPLLSPSPPAPNPSQHQGLFQWANSSHEVAKVLEFQPQHQSFQRISRTDLLLQNFIWA